jgi:hypothetical protein
MNVKKFLINFNNLLGLFVVYEIMIILMALIGYRMSLLRYIVVDVVMMKFIIIIFF